MKKVTMYGASDDQIIVDVDGISEQFDIPGAGALGICEDADSFPVITVNFRFEGEWEIFVGVSGPAPEWPLYFGERPDYEGDPAVTFELPDSFALALVT